MFAATTLTEADIATACAAIAAGATYAQAAMAAGVRPSALRFRKQTDQAVALRLRVAWHEQARRLRAALASDRTVGDVSMPSLARTTWTT